MENNAAEIKKLSARLDELSGQITQLLRQWPPHLPEDEEGRQKAIKLLRQTRSLMDERGGVFRQYIELGDKIISATQHNVGIIRAMQDVPQKDPQP